MSSQRYARVNAHDDDDDDRSSMPVTTTAHSAVPHSPPPSFRSRASSPTSRHLLAEHDPLVSDADRTLADTFDSPSDDEDDEYNRQHGDDRQRLMRASSSEPAAAAAGVDAQPTSTAAPSAAPRDSLQRRVTQFPSFTAQQQPGARVYGGGSMANDGVFANLSAKPTRGDTDHLEEKPPTYEQAAADATPPYWETTIHLPGLSSADEVFVDGLPVGSVFSFIWNGMISMSFQIVGFLLTYLLHTTHAAKNGSRAGLGITLVQFGFGMKGSGSAPSVGGDGGGGSEQGAPPDPNSHDFDPDTMGNGDGSGAGGMMDFALSKWDWFAYILMIVGWFILIRSVSDFLRARRHEQLVLQSPDRGLGVAVVAEGERPESTV